MKEYSEETGYEEFFRYIKDNGSLMIKNQKLDLFLYLIILI